MVLSPITTEIPIPEDKWADAIRFYTSQLGRSPDEVVPAGTDPERASEAIWHFKDASTGAESIIRLVKEGYDSLIGRKDTTEYLVALSDAKDVEDTFAKPRSWADGVHEEVHQLVQTVVINGQLKTRVVTLGTVYLKSKKPLTMDTGSERTILGAIHNPDFYP